MSKKIVITGASAGFGKLITETLIAGGHTVVASMRKPDGRPVAEELAAAGAHIVELDVTDEASVAGGMEQAVSKAGGIDVVINNAGVGVLGLQETFTADDWKTLFEVNVFGVQRVNRAALPIMRKQGSGLLVHISSLLGRFTLPFYGPYNASKWALEALAENYRTELSALGIDSCIVEPGGYPTSFFAALIQPGDPGRAAAYGDLADAPQALLEGFEQALAANPAQNPQDVADAVASLVNAAAGTRPFRTTVDKMGMGDAIAPYNDQAEQVTRGIYSAFDMDHMLDLKTS